MSDLCVVVVDRARARLFSSESRPPPSAGVHLVERLDLHHPLHETPQHDRFTGRRSEAHATVGEHHHTLDDRRDKSDEQHDRRFIADVIDETARFVKRSHVKRVVFAAEPKTLGYLRDAFDPISRLGVRLAEIPGDLTKLSPHEIEEHVVRAGMMPAGLN